MRVDWLRKLPILALTLLGASLVIFAVLDILPGNPAQVILGPSAPPEAVAALAAQLGLDRPAPQRYLAWLAGMAHGDFGVSYAYSAPVAGLMAERLAVTVPLALMAMALNVVLSLSLGLFAASRHGTVGDLGTVALTQVGLAIPNVWFGILLILIFAVRLQWFSAGGFPGWEAGIGTALASLVLPALALALAQTAILARVTRGAVLDTLHEDYVRTALAKGMTRRAVLWRHVLRNALVPITTIMGLQFANLIAGTVVIETVFTLPGLGRLAFQAIANRDLIVLRSTLMVFAAAVILVNLVVDIAQSVIDPRLDAARL